MSHRAYAVAAYTTGAFAAAFAILAAEVHMWWPVALLVVSATACYGLGEALRGAHHVARDREQAARPGGPNPSEPRPCCLFWASSGTVHTALCRNAKEPAS